MLAGPVLPVLPAPAASAPASAVDRRDLPCPGCVARIPRGAGPHPLVVVLHGDRGSPAELVRGLRGAADARGFAVLALACPVALGCTARSFWQWRGSPAWLTQQVDALAAALAPEGIRIDRSRVSLLGWSGGASYLTDVAAELPPGFAALGLVGGGMPTQHRGACAPCPQPVYFAVGDRNPLRSLAVAAQAELRACGHALTWRPIARADHAAERAALEQDLGAALLDFLAAQTDRCARR